MNHIKDKKLWLAANYGRAHVPAPATPMTGLGLGIGFIGILLMTMAFMWMISPAITAGASLAFVTFVSLPGRNVKGIKELVQARAELKKAALAIMDAADGRDYTPEEQTKMEALKADITRAETLIQRETERLELERHTSGAAFDERAAAGGIALHERSDDDPSGGFKSHYDFLTAVMGAVPGDIDKRLARFAMVKDRKGGYRAAQGSDEQSGLYDPAGGFLVPKTVVPGVLKVTPEQDVLMNLVTPVPMSSPSVVINARVDKDHSSSVSGGLTVTRRPELIDGTTSRMSFEPVNMDARDLFGGAFASENILNDSPESFIAILSAGFGDEFANCAMRERLTGQSSGEFLGVLNSPCTISIAKEAGQATKTIVKENIDKMVARSWRYGSAVWLANNNTLPQLTSLVQVVGTAGMPVPYFTFNATGQMSLFGRPIFFTEWCKTLGTVGDLVLGVWSEFLEGTYQPIQQAESIHVRFMSNERAFKFWKRNCGQPWWKAALTPKNGDTLSPFVTLATR